MKCSLSPTLFCALMFLAGVSHADNLTVTVAGGFTIDRGIVVHEGDFYFGNNDTKSLVKMSTAGGPVTTVLTSFPENSGPGQFEIIGDTIYGGPSSYTDGGIWAGPLAGGNATTYVDNVYGGTYLGVIGDYIYYGNRFEAGVQRVSVNGGSSEQVFGNGQIQISGSNWTRANVIHDDTIYFQEYHTGELRYYDTAAGTGNAPVVIRDNPNRVGSRLVANGGFRMKPQVFPRRVISLAW